MQINNINYGSSQKAQPINKDLGKQEFLKLLVTQLNNQNPLDVQQNSEFVAQLTQFASLESLDGLNSKISLMLGNKQTENQLNAANLIGKNVSFASNKINLNGQNQINGTVKANVAQVNLKILNQKNEVVRQITLDKTNDYDFNFSFDGLDDNGNKLNTGTYTLSTDNENAAIYLTSKVNNVELNASGAIVLNTANLGKISFNQITNIGI